jgi:hypothetical protein
MIKKQAFMTIKPALWKKHKETLHREEEDNTNATMNI